MEPQKHLGTILVFVVVLIIFFLFREDVRFLKWALVVAGIGLFIPALSRKIHWLWMKFAEVLGAVMNRVILSVIFFVFLVPIAFLSRLFRKAPIQHRAEGVQSYFTDRSVTYTKKHLEELW